MSIGKQFRDSEPVILLLEPDKVKPLPMIGWTPFIHCVVLVVFRPPSM